MRSGGHLSPYFGISPVFRKRSASISQDTSHFRGLIRRTDHTSCLMSDMSSRVSMSHDRTTFILRGMSCSDWQ